MLDCLSKFLLGSGGHTTKASKNVSTRDKRQLPVRQPQGQFHDLRNY